MGCKEGRSCDRWVDFDFFGHQLVAHKVENHPSKVKGNSNPVDGQNVPVPHFGIVLTLPVFKKLAAKLTAAKIKFGIAPYLRFKGLAGEQMTMFFKDPSGNALEFKAFKDIG